MHQIEYERVALKMTKFKDGGAESARDLSNRGLNPFDLSDRNVLEKSSNTARPLNP